MLVVIIILLRELAETKPCTSNERRIGRDGSISRRSI